MASLPPELPRDPEKLQAMLIAREAEIGKRCSDCNFFAAD